MIRQNFINSDHRNRVPITVSKPTKTEECDDNQVELQGKQTKTQETGDDLVELQGKPSTAQESEDKGVESQSHSPITLDIKVEAINSDATPEDSGRERLKRHRVEVAGRVWIPDKWGQEELLKDWIDCSAFNASLVPGGIMSARAALVEEGKRANSGGLRIQNRC